MATSPKILLIESDAQFAYLIRRYASTCGCACVAYATDALTHARREKPALILLGLPLPHVKDDALLHSLKTDAVTQAIPVFICSSLARPAYEFADGFLLKPVMYADFLVMCNDAGLSLAE